MDGPQTFEEWSSTALAGLVPVAFADSADDDINCELTPDGTVVPGPPDAAIGWVDADLTDGPGRRMVSLKSLNSFTNIDANVVFGGIASAATTLMAA